MSPRPVMSQASGGGERPRHVAQFAQPRGLKVAAVHVDHPVEKAGAVHAEAERAARAITEGVFHFVSVFPRAFHANDGFHRRVGDARDAF